MREQKRDCLKITVPRELALDCQRVLETQGVPLNVTQAVKAMLTFAVVIVVAIRAGAWRRANKI